ncbi:MAG: hypothetical protein JOY90_17135 [Bradyrhizobium sp.]|nr:hypothetical protein [Bradyrhizobium sp.]
MQCFDRGRENGVEAAPAEIWREGLATGAYRHPIDDRTCHSDPAQPRKRFRKISRALAEEDTGLNGAGRIGPDGDCAGVRYVPRSADGNQGFVTVLAIILEPNIRLVET